MNANALKVIGDLEQAGFDMSSIKRQAELDPIKNQAADRTFDGILRQQEYTKLANAALQAKKEYEAKIKGLASAHDSIQHLPTNSPAFTAMKTIIDDYEKDLIEAGFSEASVKALSAEKVEKLNEVLRTIPNNESSSDNNVESNRGADMNNNNNNNVGISPDVLRTALGNTAMGSVLIGMQVNSMERELRELGVNPTAAQLQELAQKLPSHLNDPTGKGNVETAFEEVFKVSEVRATKAKEAEDARLLAEYNRGRTDQAKEDGIPARQRVKLVKHSILDSKTIGQNSRANQSESIFDEQGNLDPNKVPRNAQGEIERYKIRGANSEIRQDRKARRLANAANLMDQIQEHNANDPMFIG